MWKRGKDKTEDTVPEHLLDSIPDLPDGVLSGERVSADLDALVAKTRSDLVQSLDRHLRGIRLGFDERILALVRQVEQDALELARLRQELSQVKAERDRLQHEHKRQARALDALNSALQEGQKA